MDVIVDSACWWCSLIHHSVVVVAVVSVGFLPLCSVQRDPKKRRRRMNSN
jgi:hypothetical protein